MVCKETILIVLENLLLSAGWLPHVLAEDLEVQCYLPEWTLNPDGNNPFRISDIASTKACDVIIYAFFKIENNAPASANGNKYRQHFAELNDLKEAQPNLKLFLGVGGWGSGEDFTSVSSTTGNRTLFAAAVVTFLRRWSFDGVNIDWQFPEPAAAQDHASLLQNIREAFDIDANKTHRERLKLTTTITQTVRLGYIPKEIARYADGVNVLTYDYKGNWGPTIQKTAVNAGLPDVKKSVTDWISARIPSDKLSLGIPFYGRTWTLSNSISNTSINVGVGQEAIGPGLGGFLTYDNGTLSYAEICTNLKTGWTHRTDPATSTSYAYSKNQWVSYDDSDSISIKITWAKSQNLKGASIWHIGLDDRQGLCGPRFPLLAAVNKAVCSSVKTTPPVPVQLITTNTSPVDTARSSGRTKHSKAAFLTFVFAFLSLIFQLYLFGLHVQ